MPAAIGQLGALTADTVRGTLRRPAIGLLLLLAVLLSGVLPTLDLLSFLAKRALVADAQTALILLVGVLGAGLAVASGLGDEYRRGAPELLYRNVSPTTLAWGRFAGLAAALSILWLPLAVAALWGSRVALDDYHDDTAAAQGYFAICGLAVLLAAGGSRRRGASFSATLAGWLAVLLPAGLALLSLLPRAGVAGHELVDWTLLPHLGLLLPALWLAAAVAWLVATALDGSAVLAATVAVFVAGLALPALLGSAGALLPNWQAFWIERGASIGWRPVVAELVRIAAMVTLTGAVLARRSGR